MNKNYNVKIQISKYFILRWPRVAYLADIISIETIFMKTTFTDSKKIKRIRKYVSKSNLYLYFLV